MELGFRTEPEGGALGVFGELVALCEGEVIKALVAEVFDQPVMQRHQEIIGARGAIMLLRIEPPRRNVGVPSQR